MNFNNKHVAIVGVGGMGAEIVKALRIKGVTTFFLADNDIKKCYSAVSSISSDEACGGAYYTAGIDVMNPASWDNLFSKIQMARTPIDIFIYTAGVIGPGGKSKFITKWTMDDILQVCTINYAAMIGLTNEFMNRFFIPQKHGRIITIASLAGLDPESGSEMYDSTKAAVIGFMRSFMGTLNGMRERKGIDVRANCLTPGMVRTGMISHLEENKELMEGLLARFNQKLLSEPSEVAAQVCRVLAEDLHGEFVDEKGRSYNDYLDSIKEKIRCV